MRVRVRVGVRCGVRAESKSALRWACQEPVRRWTAEARGRGRVGVEELIGVEVGNGLGGGEGGDGSAGSSCT